MCEFYFEVHNDSIDLRRKRKKRPEPMLQINCKDGTF